MRRANWLDAEDIRRLRLPEIVDRHLSRSLSLLEELIETTVRSLEAPTPTAPAALQARLWEAVSRWNHDLGEVPIAE